MKLHPYKITFLGLMGALILLGCQNSETKGQTKSKESAQKKSQVIMTEYSDFECPTCAYFHPIVKKLKEHYGDKLKINYRYFPLNSHQYSTLAARAAESARKQGKFQGMYDMLFDNQKKWAESGNPQPTFINYAQKLDLDIKQFKNDLNAAKTQKTVMQQKQEGIDAGVNSTPTFYINGEQVNTLPRNYEQFKALLDQFMKETANTSNTNT